MVIVRTIVRIRHRGGRVFILLVSVRDPALLLLLLSVWRSAPCSTRFLLGRLPCLSLPHIIVLVLFLIFSGTPPRLLRVGRLRGFTGAFATRGEEVLEKTGVAHVGAVGCDEDGAEAGRASDDGRDDEVEDHASCEGRRDPAFWEGRGKKKKKKKNGR
jgi:hypothetical protein